MKMDNIYIWPNHICGNLVAERFYEKVTGQLESFPTDNDLMISFCLDTRAFEGDNDRLVHIHAPHDSRESMETYIKKCGGLNFRECINTNSGTELDIDNAKRYLLAKFGIKILKCVRRINNKIEKYHFKPDFTVGTRAKV